ncbi:MaoC family dehydratase [Nocardioides gilvus]|uniref:MaoC family dehydratase n=1 Tax=Nocardioides gilvus TaxID=1735589 RepID=UPI000D742B16|nr:MaoC/PaaZ C-terminal domain-containing protein [Nocardioides gilvus]
MGALGHLTRAALPSVPGVNQLPGVRKVKPRDFAGVHVTTPPVPIDAGHVARYSQVCGFPRRDTVPVTYPHLLTFGAQMSVMADQAFPWPAMGSVHLENRITSHRPIGLDETLGVQVDVETTRPHAKGTVVDFVSTIRSGEETVWESVSSYLVRGGGTDDAPSGLTFPEAPDGKAVWSLGDDLGRRYGRVSGDMNPIHLYPLTAKALGFRRHIAHGMWTKARALAAIENRLPDAVQIDVAFKKPVFLPSKVAFGVTGDRSAWHFAVRNPKDGSPHVVGRVTAL